MISSKTSHSLEPNRGPVDGPIKHPSCSQVCGCYWLPTWCPPRSKCLSVSDYYRIAIHRRCDASSKDWKSGTCQEPKLAAAIGSGQDQLPLDRGLSREETARKLEMLATYSSLFTRARAWDPRIPIPWPYCLSILWILDDQVSRTREDLRKVSRFVIYIFSQVENDAHGCSFSSSLSFYFFLVACRCNLLVGVGVRPGQVHCTQRDPGNAQPCPAVACLIVWSETSAIRSKESLKRWGDHVWMSAPQQN